MTVPIIGRAGDPVVRFASNDPEMSLAIDSARATLSGFLQQVADPGFNSESQAVKVVYLTPSQEEEHIWVDVLRLNADGTVAGLVANVPHNLPDIHLGDPVIIQRDRISDWGYMQDGQLYGYYTLRVMLPRLPEADAVSIRGMLAPLPQS